MTEVRGVEAPKKRTRLIDESVQTQIWQVSTKEKRVLDNTHRPVADRCPTTGAISNDGRD